jgi:outer membrane protein
MPNIKEPKKNICYFLNKIKIVFILYIYFFINTLPSYGQSPLVVEQHKLNVPLKINLESAMKMAIQHSYSLKSAQANLNSSEFEESVTIRSLAPNFAGSGNLNWSQGNQNSNSFSLPQNSPNSSSNATLTITQPIIGIIPTLHSLTQKEITTNINKMMVEQTKIQAALFGASYYLNTQLASQQLSIANATLDTVKKSKDDAEALYQTGSIFKDDYLRIILQYSQTQQAVNNAKSQLEISLFSLAQAIGINDQNSIELDSNDISSWEIKNPKIPDLEKAKKIALKNNQSLLIAKDNIKFAEMNKTLNLDNYLPTLNAFASYTKNLNPSSSANSPSSLTSYDNYVTYGIQISWNIWDWGVRNAQDSSLTEQISNQRYLEKSQKEQILNLVVQNYSTIQNNISAVSLAKDAVDTAEEAYKLVSYRFLNGQVAALDLVTSQQSLTTAKAALAQSRFNLDLAWLSFQTTLGLEPKL